jgi:hypothetical protein
VQVVVDKFTSVMGREASANESERTRLTQALDRGVTEGRTSVAVGRDRLPVGGTVSSPISRRSVAAPALSAVIGAPRRERRPRLRLPLRLRLPIDCVHAGTVPHRHDARGTGRRGATFPPPWFAA